MTTDSSDQADVFDLVGCLSPSAYAKAKAAAHAWYAAELKRPLRVGRRRTRGRKAVNHFNHEIVNQKTEAALLDALLLLGRNYGIVRMRDYVLAGNGADETLASVDCAGHARDQAIRLRLGNIVSSLRCVPFRSVRFILVFGS